MLFPLVVLSRVAQALLHASRRPLPPSPLAAAASACASSRGLASLSASAPQLCASRVANASVSALGLQRAPSHLGRGPGLGARFDSTKRKRRKMMNKHKFEKRAKTMRSLSSLNVRGGKSRVG